MNILELPLKKEWYKLIECGEKKEEYREIKPYWTKRLLQDIPFAWHNIRDRAVETNDCSLFYGKKIPTRYTHVRFRYGYTKRTMLFNLEYITLGKGNPEWGALDTEVFIIRLGKRCDMV